MFKKTKLAAILVVCALILGGCSITEIFPKSGKSTTDSKDKGQNKDSGYVTDRTDYTIFYKESSPATPGGVTMHQYVVGHFIPEAETIKYNAYFVPWRIDFSQVQRTTLSNLAGACNNLREQVVYIDGWIDLDLSDIGVNASNLPNSGPVKLKGSVHEKVSGEAGTWQCGDSEIATQSANSGSAQYIQSVSGTHTANFSGASNMTSMKIGGAEIYLDLSYEESIQFIWPAGTKIEFAPEGTPVPLEPLPSSSL